MTAWFRGPLTFLQLATGTSWLGDGLVSVALPLFILQQTDRPVAVGVAALSRVLGVYASSVCLGPYIDRWAGKNTAVRADVIAGVTSLLVPALAWTGHATITTISVATFLGAVTQRPGFLARNRAIPEVASASSTSLERASGLNEMLYQATLLIGPVVAGLLVVTWEPAWLLVANAMSYILAAIVVMVGVPGQLMGLGSSAQPEAWSWWAEFKVGIRFVIQHRLLWSMIAVVASRILLMNAPLLSIIVPLIVTQGSGSSVQLGLSFSAFAVGAFAGAGLFSLLGARGRQFSTWRLCYALIALPYVLIAFGMSDTWIIPAMAIVGLAEGSSTPLYAAFRFRTIPRDMRGRIAGATTPVTGLAPTVGIFGTTLLLDLSSMMVAAVILGAGLFLVVLWISIDPIFRQLDA